MVYHRYIILNALLECVLLAYTQCILKGHCTEKMKRLNMIGIKLVKHHNILLKRLPTQIASYSTLKLLDTPPFR